jgi:predicted helicase
LSETAKCGLFLEWSIDQHQVAADKRSGVTSDPNWKDDLGHIVDVVWRMITVSLEPVKVITRLSTQMVQ